MCEKHVFPASVEQNERSQSLVWVSTPQRDNLFCFLFSGTIIVGLIVPENKTGFFIFQHFGRLFLPGTLKNVPFSRNERLVNFREESNGIGRFCSLEFQRVGNWPSFDTQKNRNREDSTKPVACVVQFHPVSIKIIETGPVGHPLELRACKTGQSH